VVLMNSGAGIDTGPTWAAYGASKHGLRGFADALRAEEAAHGVRVTSMFLGRAATPMQQKVHAQEGNEYDASRWLLPETVAEAVLRVVDLPRDATVPDLRLRPAVR
jgi:short-subunit dehydrogenase